MIEHRDHIGEIEVAVIVGVAGILAVWCRSRAEEPLQQQNRIADIDPGVGVAVPTKEVLRWR